MNKIYTLLFFAFIGTTSINAQCDSGTSGLAVIELEAPRLSDIEPLSPGEEYTFVFFYNYLFTAKGSDCVDEASINLSVEPAGSVDIVSGPTVAGAFITVTVSPNSSNFFIRITADDCSEATSLSCATLPIRELTVPVGYLSLDAKKDNRSKGISVDWATTTEVNNDVFEVQRSNGSETFQTIGKVDGSGTTSEVTNYTFLDTDPLFGANYYRLKQIDFNGQSTFSDVLTVKYVGNVSVAVSPNPSLKGDKVRVLLNSDQEELAIVKVFNIAGKQIRNVSQSVSEGANIIEIENDFAQGIYIVNVQVGAQSVTKRLVVSQLRP